MVTASIPRPGMLATVRNRRALVISVEEFAGQTGDVSRLVGVEYMDAQAPAEDHVLWEHEAGAEVIEPKRLPRIESDAPMRPADFNAVQRSARWLALSPYAGADGLSGAATPIAAPLFGAIQIEDYQLVPLVRALRMPRVSLALLDDVGLGKSIEAGLILSELILRRRLRRILILCPAWLKAQWREEMRSKFSLSFDVVDRPETHHLRRQLGMDTNPWRTFPRIIASYHYLKQPDVLEDFKAASQSQHSGTATLPWDFLIVDEAHNCMPAAAGEDSALSKMLTSISHFFEHKLFLTATPHNGYTQSFTGLLEQLDPVRFTRKGDITASERRRVEEIVIRRLKSEINNTDEKANRTPRFVEREIVPLPLYSGASETALTSAFEQFRQHIREILAKASHHEQRAGYFAIEVLQKRFLSCPYAFADSWHRFLEGFRHDEEASIEDISAAERAVREEIDDDAETEGRLAYASRVAGAWLRRYVDRLQNQVAMVDTCLFDLGLVPDANHNLPDPNEDVRLERLLNLIEQRLREGRTWQDDERLIVFTEYKTTLVYLECRLRAAYPKDPHDRFLVLYGGMSEVEREEIKAAFNDPCHPVRILVATDAASEGANLQETARLLLHFDIPWNPSRLDQRNGRLDRHGQARDVSVYHFTSETDADIRFLGKVLKKVETIRADLGSMTELFDAAFARRFRQLLNDDVIDKALDKDIEKKRRRTKHDIPRTPITGAEDEKSLMWLIRELDFSPDNLQSLLEVSLGAYGGSGFKFLGPDERGRFRFPPIPERWRSIVDAELRLKKHRGTTGSLPAIMFDGSNNIEIKAGRSIYRPAKYTVLMHLGHPLVRQALLYLSRARFPGTDEARSSSQWIVRRGHITSGCDALVLVTVEEMAVNDLRETFHQWARTLRFPIRNGQIGELQPHVPAADDSTCVEVAPDLTDHARNVWMDVHDAVTHALRQHSEELLRMISDHLARDLRDELKMQSDLFRERRQELAKQLERDLKDLEREMSELTKDTEQGDLFADTDCFARFDHATRDISAERERRERHHQDMRQYLEIEESRIIKDLVPRRYTLRGDVQVFPVTVEIRFPAMKDVGR